jgi:hypothetical protein
LNTYYMAFQLVSAVGFVVRGCGIESSLAFF